MSTAAVGLEASAGLQPAGRVGIVFKRLPPGRFDELKQEIVDLLKLQGEGSLTVEAKTDDLGFEWLILDGADFQNATAALHSAATSRMEDGLGDLLLAVAFKFTQHSSPVSCLCPSKEGNI